MRKLFLIIPLLATVVLVSSCSSCSKPKRDPSMADFKMPVIPDSTVYATLKAVDGDTLVITLDETGREHRMSFADARFQNKLKGQLTTGDKFAVHADFSKKTVKSLVNLTNLEGLWMDNAKEKGIRIRLDGGIASVNDTVETMRGWHVKNGMFIISYVDDKIANAGGGVYEVQDTSEIINLTADTLVLDFGNHVRTLTHPGLITIKPKARKPHPAPSPMERKQKRNKH